MNRYWLGVGLIAFGGSICVYCFARMIALAPEMCDMDATHPPRHSRGGRERPDEANPALATSVAVPHGSSGPLSDGVSVFDWEKEEAHQLRCIVPISDGRTGVHVAVCCCNDWLSDPAKSQEDARRLHEFHRAVESWVGAS